MGPLVSPGYWLKMAAQAYLLELDTRLRPLGLTHTQFTLLAAVGWVGRGNAEPTQQAAASFAGIDRMMASKVLATLETAELVLRTAHPTDGRAKLLTLTTRGRQTLREAVEIAKNADREFFAGVAADPLRTTLRSLVRERWSEHSEGRDQAAIDDEVSPGDVAQPVASQHDY